ncbi:ribosome small subunit-dependent GTPase A [Kineothrix sp. MB12-C1]|uniref:ribosome small subunit-dependent GTPase A n=1 Tax=Kineothrix sp. MB12-C1 TaxID=3070215 RepID=UPI0027D249ED|nr:ribosome small subunit-dependent GTPase A [Kineothrix sp. MB12-C1]WMC92220.1 ribosome small subunit-dependent GTPase A [Kineothrix sp. MB12-C1]
MKGKIIKGIAGFYYIYAGEAENTHGRIYECKAKGIFRKDNIKPLVGDDVMMEVLDEEKLLGNITAILPRENELIRPAVANIDQALVIFAIVKPEPNFNLLDRFLIMMERQGLSSIICFNKQDIATREEKEELKQAYESCGYRVLFVSAKENEGMEELHRLLLGKTTAVAGPSGVGKSSIINRLNPEANMEIGDISRKIERGKHTTRHSEIIALSGNTYIMDTPGFTSLRLFDMEKEELREYYPEFAAYEKYCRFAGCAHMSEPGCGVKEALADGKVSSVRYRNYILLYGELREQKKY